MTLRVADDTMLSHRFRAGAPLQVGVEEELFLVGATGHRVMLCTDEHLADRSPRFSPGRLKGELCDGVSSSSLRCASVDDAIRALSDLRRNLARRGRVELIGAGMHPRPARRRRVPSR